jgi:predicted nucleotidyltransferase
MKSSEIIPYAMDFASFVLEQIPDKMKENIRSIVLFGSGARGEHRKSSDVDIFIEVSRGVEALESEIEKAAERFYGSIRYRNYWRLKGFQYIFSCKVGDERSWRNLYPALMADGIMLYGKYCTQEDLGKRSALFTWENIRSSGMRVNLHRSLHGYKVRGKAYPGLLERYHGVRLTKGTILVPLEHHLKFREFFDRLGVPVKELLISAI